MPEGRALLRGDIRRGAACEVSGRQLRLQDGRLPLSGHGVPPGAALQMPRGRVRGGRGALPRGPLRVGQACAEQVPRGSQPLPGLLLQGRVPEPGRMPRGCPRALRGRGLPHAGAVLCGWGHGGLPGRPPFPVPFLRGGVRRGARGLPRPERLHGGEALPVRNRWRVPGVRERVPPRRRLPARAGALPQRGMRSRRVPTGPAVPGLGGDAVPQQGMRGAHRCLPQDLRTPRTRFVPGAPGCGARWLVRNLGAPVPRRPLPSNPGDPVPVRRRLLRLVAGALRGPGLPGRRRGALPRRALPCGRDDP